MHRYVTESRQHQNGFPRYYRSLMTPIIVYKEKSEVDATWDHIEMSLKSPLHRIRQKKKIFQADWIVKVMLVTKHIWGTGEALICVIMTGYAATTAGLSYVLYQYLESVLIELVVKSTLGDIIIVKIFTGRVKHWSSLMTSDNWSRTQAPFHICW